MKPEIIKNVEKLLPKVKFISGKSFYWSPETSSITYNRANLSRPTGQWALYHEIAHAILGHISYSSDLNLLKLEVAAWDKAKELGKADNIQFDEDHIQDCLDTYRDWLHRRSSCPKCNVVSIQKTAMIYKCHNCSTTWNVTASRFCRPYRKTNVIKQEKRSQVKLATFS